VAGNEQAGGANGWIDQDWAITCSPFCNRRVQRHLISEETTIHELSGTILGRGQVQLYIRSIILFGPQMSHRFLGRNDVHFRPSD
ncbi:hypothetical protein, partial [Streptomyces sp. 021-4]|uniref:hypothetical protein n=1 Tax=Streptomyces sp. 021-4 TaxID=2789260 RepID=UPI0039F4700D